jgi:hypothetical protein
MTASFKDAKVRLQNHSWEGGEESLPLYLRLWREAIEARKSAPINNVMQTQARQERHEIQHPVIGPQHPLGHSGQALRTQIADPAAFRGMSMSSSIMDYNSITPPPATSTRPYQGPTSHHHRTITGKATYAPSTPIPAPVSVRNQPRAPNAGSRSLGRNIMDADNHLLSLTDNIRKSVMSACGRSFQDIGSDYLYAKEKLESTSGDARDVAFFQMMLKTVEKELESRSNA